MGPFYDFFIGFWNCSNSVGLLFFFMLLFLVNYLSIGTYLEYCNLTLNTNKKSRHQTYIGKHLVFHFCSYRPITCLYYILFSWPPRRCSVRPSCNLVCKRFIFFINVCIYFNIAWCSSHLTLKLRVSVVEQLLFTRYRVHHWIRVSQSLVFRVVCFILILFLSSHCIVYLPRSNVSDYSFGIYKLSYRPFVLYLWLIDYCSTSSKQLCNYVHVEIKNNKIIIKNKEKTTCVQK